MPRLVPCLLLFSLLMPGLAQDARPKKLSSKELRLAKALLEEYFEAADDEAREAVRVQLEAIDHPSKSDIKKLLKHSFKQAVQGPRLEPGNLQTCTHPDFPGSYILSAPPDAWRGKKVGVFILLHGGGAGSGAGEQIQGLLGAPGGAGMIHVYPTVIEKVATAWNTEREEQYLLAIIADLKRNFMIDTNRVYLAGHSMGGYGSWSIGPRHADLFAALSPQAGGVFVSGGRGGALGLERGLLPNLLNLPIWFYNSTDDTQVSADSSIRAAELLAELKEEYGPFDYVWKEYSDIGHGLPREGVGEIWEWMLEKRREPYPERVLWEPSRSYKRDFYWLHLAQSRSSGQLDVSREGNTFTVRGNPAGLSLMLNSEMIDYDEPVVVVDGNGVELYNGPVYRSIVALADSIAARCDLEMWFDGALEIDARRVNRGR